jgi:hypothetical protein
MSVTAKIWQGLSKIARTTAVVGPIIHVDRVLEDIQTRGLFTNIHGDHIFCGPHYPCGSGQHMCDRFRTSDESVAKDLDLDVHFERTRTSDESLTKKLEPKCAF